MTTQYCALGKSKKALILGLGASGMACARYLASQGWALSVADTRLAPPNAAQLLALCPEAKLTTGSLPSNLDQNIKLLVVSPGLSIENGPSGELVKQAREKGIQVVGEIELFARALQDLKEEKGYCPKIFGITGTNGKTTTVTLLATLLKSARYTVALAGNVGPNALDVLSQAQASGRLPDAWVLELSSFQLATTESLKLDVGLLTNITEDHVDWHGSMQAYAQAKAHIFDMSHLAIINRDDEETHKVLASKGMPKTITFGDDEPKSDGDWGLKVINGAVHLGYAHYNDVAKQGDLNFTSVLLEDDLKLAGRHNTRNVLGVLAILKTLPLNLDDVMPALKGYRGEAHRVQPLFEADGVLVVDDSKGTNVGAVMAAVKGFADRGRRVLIVLGGDGKGQDFSPLNIMLAGRVGAVALIGRDAQKIGAVLTNVNAPIKHCMGMAEAVSWLWGHHQKGDVLLLSPGCASWDMYKNYAQRSEDFLRCAQSATSA